ncbi:MAG TPA: response regulator [Flavobacteriales bacterium]
MYTTTDVSERPMHHVLLIDDEKEICFLLSNVLRRTGALCTEAHSVAQGRSALRDRHFDAVFVDIHLPDGLGYDLIPEIRNTQPEARVIAISAVDNERLNATARGADLFIAKPFDRTSILGGLEQLGLHFVKQ